MTGETDKKIICFFSGDITREGGTENVAVLVANALARQKKYEIIFLSLVEQRDIPFFPICPEIRRYRLGEKWIQPGPGYLAVLPKLKRFLRERRVDVLVDIDIVLDSLSIPVKGSGTKGVMGTFQLLLRTKKPLSPSDSDVRGKEGGLLCHHKRGEPEVL